MGERKTMQQHVKILAVLHIVLSSLGILAGLIAMAVFGGLASLANWSESSQNGIGAVSGGFVGLLGAAVMLVIFCVSVPGLIAGIGLLSYQRWARILTIIISALDLFAPPLHTALGIYGLWLLLSNEGSTLFERSTPLLGR
jgi:hypothetical protein